MKYRLIQMVDGVMVKSETEGDNVYAMMEVRGFAFDGLHVNHRNRAELQGQPKFKNVLGPMWDGDAVRYECGESYAVLSA